MCEKVLELKGVCKSFPGVMALDHVDFELRKGEVHALLGENGAGKSTLIKIIAGIYEADEGELWVNGQKADINSVEEARQHGISVIHQELCLARNMTVAENIFMGREFLKKAGFVDFQKMNEEAKLILDRLGSAIKPTAVVSTLATAQQQVVEIAKALSENANIIVMDEPSAMLARNDVEKLFEIVAALREKGISVVYISHRMDEIFTVANRVTVLRDGKYVGTKNICDTDRQDLIKMVVGREVDQFYISSDRKISDELALEIKNLTTNKVKNISIKLRKGEILGISGLVGAGRTELAQALYGIDPILEGEIWLMGEKVMINSPMDAIEKGLVLVPESRKDYGLVLIQDVGFNITITVLETFMKLIKRDVKKEQAIIDEFFDKLSIRASSSRQIVEDLSGGNQQKVVLAKWLATRPKVLLLDEPTRGIDVGAKAEIYAIMDELARSGVSIVMISSELQEILNMSDRVYVMYSGSIAGCVEKQDLTQEKVISYALGVN